jgi:hypothetical protein
VADLFDFCVNSRVEEEGAPTEQTVTSMNGWDFVAKPTVPYKAKWKVTLEGLRWYLNAAGNALDTTTDPQHNAGRLLMFYRTNRQHTVFQYQHEFLGLLDVRFAEPLELPKAIQNSGGLCDPVQVTIIHHNPGY